MVTNLAVNKEIDIISRYPSLHKHQIAGDFRLVVMKKYLSLENDIPFMQTLIMSHYSSISITSAEKSDSVCFFILF